MPTYDFDSDVASTVKNAGLISGGGAHPFWAEFDVQVGVKIHASGAHETIFYSVTPFPFMVEKDSPQAIARDAAVTAATAKAMAAVAANPGFKDKRVDIAICFTSDKSRQIGPGGPNWKVVQHKTWNRWDLKTYDLTTGAETGKTQRNMTQVIMPALADLGILSDGKYILKIQYVPDNTKKPVKADDGTYSPDDYLWKPIKLYTTTQAALEDAVASSGNVASPATKVIDIAFIKSHPELAITADMVSKGYDESGLTSSLTMIINALKTKTPVQVAGDFLLPVSWIVALKGHLG